MIAAELGPPAGAREARRDRRRPARHRQGRAARRDPSEAGPARQDRAGRDPHASRRSERRSSTAAGSRTCASGSWRTTSGPDGKGYPAGLTDAEIPLEAKILAVADAYEAMTADRVYRAGDRGARSPRRAPSLLGRSVRLARRRRVPHRTAAARTRAVASATLKWPKHSVSLVIEGPEGLLLVRRPDDDESLPGVWGLPAVSLAPGESEEDAVRRAGRDKLGVEVEPLEPVGREGGMTDWRVRVCGRRAGRASARRPTPSTRSCAGASPPTWCRPRARGRSAAGCCCALAV